MRQNGDATCMMTRPFASSTSKRLVRIENRRWMAPSSRPPPSSTSSRWKNQRNGWCAVRNACLSGEKNLI